MTYSVPLWLQIVTIVLAPVLALVGVGVGARMSRSAEGLQWLRNSRLQAYSTFLHACNSYDVASRQLTESLKADDRDEQLTAREKALNSIRDVSTSKESVLLLGSAVVQASCESVSKAIYAVNSRTARLISGATDEDGPESGLTLTIALESFREAVRSELQVTSRGRRL